MYISDSMICPDKRIGSSCR